MCELWSVESQPAVGTLAKAHCRQWSHRSCGRTTSKSIIRQTLLTRATSEAAKDDASMTFGTDAWHKARMERRRKGQERKRGSRVVHLFTRVILSYRPLGR